MAQTCQICSHSYEDLSEVGYIIHGRVFFGTVCTKCRTCEKCKKLLGVTYDLETSIASITCECGTETFNA